MSWLDSFGGSTETSASSSFFLAACHEHMNSPAQLQMNAPSHSSLQEVHKQNLTPKDLQALTGTLETPIKPGPLNLSELQDPTTLRLYLDST